MSDAKIMGVTLGTCGVVLIAFLAFWFIPRDLTPAPSPVAASPATKPVVIAVATKPSRPTTARIRPAPPARPATVIVPEKKARPLAGAAWLTRNDGGSDLLRGLEIVFVGDVISSDALKKQYAALAAAYRKEAAEQIENAGKFTAFSDNYEKIAKHLSDAADDWDNKAAALPAQISPTVAGKALEEIRAADEAAVIFVNAQTANPVGFYTGSARQLAQLSREGVRLLRLVVNNDAVMSSPQFVLARSRTDVNGKYQVADVPEGAKYLVAGFASGARQLAWIVPLDGSQQSVDLDNANAIIVWNK